MFRIKKTTKRDIEPTGLQYPAWLNIRHSKGVK